MPGPTLLDAQLRSGDPVEIARAKERIMEALEKEHGSIPKTAARLSVSRRTLSRLLVRAGLVETAADLRRRSPGSPGSDPPAAL